MSTATNPLITDVFESKDLKVDRDLGVIRGVKVLGHVSANGREYSKSAVSKARTMYEGLRVNINHPKKAGDQRDLADRFGRLTRVREASDGLYADLEYLKSHPLAEMATEAAERMPDQLGLSHNAEGRVVTRNGKQLVEEIIRVRSVDLVSDPATVRGLFEAEGMMNGEEMAGDMGDVPAASGGNAIAEAFKAEINKIIDGDGDVQTKASAIKDLLKALDQTMSKLNGEKKSAPAGDDKPEEKPTEESRSGTADPTLSQLQEQLQELRAKDECRTLFESAGVTPEPLQLTIALRLNGAERKQFVESLKGAARSARPRSAAPMVRLFEGREDRETPAPKDAKEFAARMFA